MRDLSYTEALASAPEPHVILLGPVACHTCGAWVEWAGTDWLALDSTEPHDCTPYLEGGYLPGQVAWTDQAHPMAWGEHPDSSRELVLVIAGAIALLIGLAWLAQSLRQAQGG